MGRALLKLLKLLKLHLKAMLLFIVERDGGSME